MGSRCYVRDRTAPAGQIALAVVRVIASATGQGTAAAIAQGIVAPIGRARRIVPKVVATASKPAVEIAQRLPRPLTGAAALHAEIEEAVAAEQ